MKRRSPYYEDRNEYVAVDQSRHRTALPDY